MRLLLTTALFALCGAQGALAQCPNDDSLNNNDLGSAFNLPSGASAYLNLAVFGVGGASLTTNDTGNDLFLLDVGPGRTVDIDTVYDFAEVALYLQLYGSNLAFIAGTNANTQTAFLSYTNPTSSTETLILRVASGQTPNGCGNYDLLVRNEACPGDDLLENFDSCPNSLPLSSVTDIQSQRLAVLDGDDDWFDVNLEPGEILDVSIFFEHARADLDLYLFEKVTGSCPNAFLTRGFSATNDEFVTYTNTSAFPMNIAIQVDWFDTVGGGSCNDYELAYEIIGSDPDDIFEDNDSICSTAGIDLGVYRDLIVKDGDSDFYEFSLFDGERGKLAVDFVHADGDLDLRLWDISTGCGSAVLVDSSDSVTDYEEVEFTSSTPGSTTFVLEVFYFPSDGGENEYDLTVAFGRAADVGEIVCVGNPNSTGIQGYTYAVGSVTVADDDLSLVSQNLPQNSFAFYNGSRGYGFVANPAGSAGNLCITGAPIGRFTGPGQIQNSGSTGLVFFPVDLANLPQPDGPVAAVPGETWFFQLWYRDSGPAGATSNFTSAVRIRFE